MLKKKIHLFTNEFPSIYWYNIYALMRISFFIIILYENEIKMNGCFHNRPVICPRSVIMASESVMTLGVASGHYILPGAIITDLGHITGPLWKHPFINTISVHMTIIAVRVHFKKYILRFNLVCFYLYYLLMHIISYF